MRAVERADLVEEGGPGGHDVRDAGATSMRPKLVTLLPPPRFTISSRAARAYSAAPRKASLRQAMGVVPAWSACPMKVTQDRRLPTMPSTSRWGYARLPGAGPARYGAPRRRRGCGGRTWPWAPRGGRSRPGTSPPRDARRQRRKVGDLARVELAREGARAEEAGVAAFLVAPRHHGERTPRAGAGLAEGVETLQAGEHPEGAVQRAALGDGVDVRPRHDGGTGPRRACRRCSPPRPPTS